MSQLYPLELTSAVGIGGELKRRGSIVWLSQSDAADLLRRGKARIPEVVPEQPAEQPAAEPKPEPKPKAARKRAEKQEGAE